MKEEIYELLKQIRNILIIIAIILLVNVIVTGMNNNNRNLSSTSGSDTSEETETEEIEYDVSAFTEVTVDEMFTKVNTSGYQVVYIGRSGCGYCRMYLPALKQAQTNFKYKTLYIDLDKVTNEGAAKMKAISDDLNEKFGYTPMVIVYKDGVYQNMRVGYSEYSALETFLTGLGMTK